jgi:hypothetical protein
MQMATWGQWLNIANQSVVVHSHITNIDMKASLNWVKSGVRPIGWKQVQLYTEFTHNLLLSDRVTVFICFLILLRTCPQRKSVELKIGHSQKNWATLLRLPSRNSLNCGGNYRASIFWTSCGCPLKPDHLSGRSSQFCIKN